MMQLALMAATVGSITAAFLKGSGAPHEPSPAMGLSVSKQLLPGNLEAVLLTGQSLVPLWVMWALTWYSEPLTQLPAVVEPSSPLEL